MYLGDFTTSNTVYVYFNTFDSNDPSASVTLTGLAVTDIKIYKNGSTTQRASDAGYTLLDTDGIDFDTITGVHGFSIDLSDNTDAGFFAAGSEYVIVVSSVTVDAATINFIAGSFSIERTGGALALLKNGTYGLSALDTELGTLATASALSTAQADLDTLTGTDGVTLATSQPNYAPNTTTPPTAAAVADAVWDEAASGHVGAGTFGAQCGTDIDAILADTNELQTDDIPTTLATLATAAALATVDSNVDAILADTGTDGVVIAAAQTVATVTDVTNQVTADVTAISGSATAADNLEASALGVVSTTVNDASATTTSFITALTEATNDHYNGRIIVFTSGALAGQATDITDYVGATKTVTVTALTEAPANGVSFVIV